jgi:predicted phage terminase large subunit-like protein
VDEDWRFDLATYAARVSDGRWRPYRWARHVAERVQEAVVAGGARIIVEAPRQHGKALEVTTPIPTPAGWKEIQQLVPGDEVFAPDGSPTRVVARSKVWRDRPVFAVTTAEKERIVADANHEWRVRLDAKSGALSVRETRWLTERQNKFGKGRNTLVAPHAGLKLPITELPIPPYVLGVWLGDGYSKTGQITKNAVDLPHFVRRFREEGFDLVPKKGLVCRVPRLQALLRRFRLFDNKHVPSTYLRAAASQRLALLQGLMDTDGYASPDGQGEFCSTKECLASAVQELLSSFGIKSHMLCGRAKLYGRDVGPKFRVLFYFKNAFSLPRKKDRAKDGTIHPGHYLRFESAGKADTVCIEVDHSSHMFLAGRSMLPTCNSNLTAQWLPTWYLDHWPDKRVVLASYASHLASGHSLKIRRVFERSALTWTRISDDKSRHNDWETTKGGGLKAVGFESGIPGIGADLLVIDDPHSGWESVQSAAQRQKVIDTYLADLRPTLQRGASTILAQTRWHKRDLAGYLMSEDSDDWIEIRMPALAEEDDPLGREPGEALCPELHSREELIALRAGGARIFAGQYQQRPTEREGSIVKRDWIQYYGGPTGVDLPDALNNHTQSWDMNFKQTVKGSYAAGTCWAECGANLYLLDARRGRWSYADAKKELPKFRDAWPSVGAILVEEAANGAAILSDLKGEIRGLIGVPATKSKELRMELVAPLFEAGNVWLPHPAIAPWVAGYVEELVDFPHGESNDLGDSTSQALDRFRRGRTKVAADAHRLVGIDGVVVPSEFMQ